MNWYLKPLPGNRGFVLFNDTVGPLAYFPHRYSEVGKWCEWAPKLIEFPGRVTGKGATPRTQTSFIPSKAQGVAFLHRRRWRPSLSPITAQAAVNLDYRRRLLTFLLILAATPGWGWIIGIAIAWLWRMWQ